MRKLSIQNKKLIITKEMINTFTTHDMPDLNTAYTKWWMNTRSDGGMRLTSSGYKVLKSMGYDSYKFKIENLMSNKNLFLMDIKLTAPYYIRKLTKVNCNLIMFGSEDAVLLNLYGGDFKSFIDSTR